MHLPRTLALIALATGCGHAPTGESAVEPFTDEAPRDAEVASEPGTSPAPPQGTPAPPAQVEPISPEAPCAVASFESTLTRVPVDIVWVVDDSGSMLDEQARIRENIASFAERIAAEGAATRVAIVTEEDLATGTSLAGSSDYAFVQADVGSHDALEVLLERFTDYGGFLRAAARTHFVAVTDDESDLDGALFRAQMQALLGHGFTFHAIASENLGGEACECSSGFLCGAAAPGDEYYALAAETSGAQVSICTLDWGSVFDRLVEAVLEGTPLPCSFAVPAPPTGEELDLDRVRLDYEQAGVSREIPRLGASACAGLDAWQYDDADAPSEIVLCPAACEALGSEGRLVVSLGCAPVVVE